MERPERPESVYLDACCYIDWAEGKDSAADVETWLRAARSGKVRIIASTVMFAEARGNGLATQNSVNGEQRLRTLLQEPYVTLVDVTRRIGLLARDVTMDKPKIKGMDAVHMATAAYAQAKVFLTRNSRDFLLAQPYRGVWVDEPYGFGGDGLFPTP